MIQAIVDAVEAEHQAAAARIAAVAAARSYTPVGDEKDISWGEITEALGEPHRTHVTAHYNALLSTEVTRTVRVADDAVERDLAFRRRRRTGA